MEAGQLTEYISFQCAVATLDAYGEETKTWTTYADGWAKIETLTTAARLVLKQLVVDATHRLTTRYVGGVLTTDRILWGERILDIVSVIDSDQRHEMLVIECKESL